MDICHKIWRGKALFANIYHVLKDEKWIFATEFGEREGHIFFILISSAHVI